MKHLLSDWEDVSRRMKHAERVLLFSDFDGTLCPIVDRPEQARIPESLRALLQTLAERPGIRIGIISGRSLADLKQRIGLQHLTYAGNHGLEIEGPDFSYVDPIAEKTRPMLDLIHRFLRQVLSPFTGVIVEHKGLSLTVHYRMVEVGALEEFKRFFEQMTTGIPSLGRIRVTSGKKVHEVRPTDSWDKGKAIGLLLERFRSASPAGNSVAIFLGDDITDEDGFRLLRRKGGVTVFVGEEDQQSLAEYYLRSPGEVEELLRRMVSSSPKDPGKHSCDLINETCPVPEA